MSSFDSNGMKSANPHSGIYKAETSRTLDMNGGTPACNQGGMMVVEGFDAYSQQATGAVSMTLTAQRADPHHVPTVCIEGNGTRESHQGDGYKESDVMFTLNTIERHAVAAPIMCLNDQGGGVMHTTHDMTGTLRAQEHGHAPIVCLNDKERGEE